MNLAYLKTCILRLTHSSSPRTFTTHLLPPHHISTYNSLLKSYLQSQNSLSTLSLLHQILQSNLKPNDLTFSLLLKSPPSLSEATQIHTHLIKSSFHQFIYIGTALLGFYAKSGCIFHAAQVFDDMHFKDTISWNSLISGYSCNGYDLNAFVVFVEMLKQKFSPCPVTMISVIPSCAKMGLLLQCKSVHGFGIKVALNLDSRVENALTAMYAKCGDLNSAVNVFERMYDKDVVSWNTMISAYGQNGYFDEALLVFKRMWEENVAGSSVTIVSLISAEAPVGVVHSYAVKIGVDSDASVNTSLVCAHAKLGDTKLAQILYASMSCKNLVALTAIISSYAEKGEMHSAMECFAQIQAENMKADAVAIVGILHGCTSFTYYSVGIALHGYCIKSGLVSDTLVVNGLISMYDKMNDVDAAASLFLSLEERPLISWNSMISIYVQSGRINDAMDLFCEMRISGCRADSITMASMLSGCSQLSLLRHGKSLHSFILRNNLTVDDFVGTALINTYTKRGSIEYAERVFKSIREPRLATWNTMISGYGMSGLENKALAHYTEMVECGIIPNDITFLGVLSACSHAGLVDEGKKYFRIMSETYSIEAGAQHCTCMIDLFGRAGFLDEAITFVKNMKAEADSVVWLALLGACYMHKEIKLAECLAKKIFLLDHQNGGFYVLMSNLYASCGRWDDVTRVRKMMRDFADNGFSGTSLTEET